MTVIFLAGNISDGFKAIGPFKDMDEATAYTAGEEGWLMTTVEPSLNIGSLNEQFTIEEELARLEQKFDEAGGRGVDLADRIDILRRKLGRE